MTQRVLQITRFLGENSSTDPRRIKPNKDDEGVAEAVECTNMETSNEGALVTSTGFELVASLDGETGGISHIMNYEKDDDESFLLIAHNDSYYFVTPDNMTPTLIGKMGEVADIVDGTVFNGSGDVRKAILGTNNTNNYMKKVIIGTDRYITITQADGSNDSLLNSSTKRIGQAFMPINKDKLVSMTIHVEENGSPSMLIADLYLADTQGKPTGSSLKTVTGRISGVSTSFAYMTFDFNYDSTTLDTNALYCVVIKGGAVCDGSNYYSVHYSPTNYIYRAGKYIQSSDSGATYSSQDLSLNFEISFYGKAEISPILNISLKGCTTMSEFLRHLFVAKGTSAHYSSTGDEDEWGEESSGDTGVVGYNDIISGFLNNGERLTTFMRRDNQGLVFNYDDTNALVLPQKDYKRKYGCLSPKTVQAVGSNAVYWSEVGVVALGAEQSYDDAGIPRPMSISKNVDTLINESNKKERKKAVAVNLEKKQEYWLALPMGVSTRNNIALVYNQKLQTWHRRTGFYPSSMATFRDSDYNEELYFGDSNSAKIYKFNDSYNYDGSGYIKKWKSKIFTFGAGVNFKSFDYIKLAGAMDYSTYFTIEVRVDTIRKKYLINKDFILGSAYSDYMGDNIYGDAYFGGVSPEESKFKRFYAPLEIARDLKEGMEMQITIEGSEPNQPFKIDFLEIGYNILSPKQVPNRRYINTQLTT